MEYTQRTIRMVSALFSAVSLLGSAQAVTVQELGVSPGETASISVAGFYTGDVSVGILKLVVDGVATDGFCIDPYHFSLSSSSEYQFRSLADAPKLPGTMGAIKAEAVSKLWAMAYSLNMTSEEAAALQLAIWETIAGDNFSVLGNDYGASFLLQRLESFSDNGAKFVLGRGAKTKVVRINAEAVRRHSIHDQFQNPYRDISGVKAGHRYAGRLTGTDAEFLHCHSLGAAKKRYR